MSVGAEGAASAKAPVHLQVTIVCFCIFKAGNRIHQASFAESQKATHSPPSSLLGGAVAGVI